MPTIKKTLRVYNFIEGYIKSNGESPTLGEICTHFNFNSLASAHQHIDKLIERGWVKRIPNISRGIRLTGTKTTPKVLCPLCNQELEITEFGYCASRATKRNLYCKGCIREKVRKQRIAIREMKAARKQAKPILHPVLQRKPNIKASPKFAFSLVYDAIKSGSRTREEIQRVTKLSFDDIGDALTELCFEAKGVMIKNRQYVPIEEVLAA